MRLVDFSLRNIISLDINNIDICCKRKKKDKKEKREICFCLSEVKITCENLPLWIYISFLTNLRYVISSGILRTKCFKLASAPGFNGDLFVR